LVNGNRWRKEEKPAEVFGKNNGTEPYLVSGLTWGEACSAGTASGKKILSLGGRLSERGNSPRKTNEGRILSARRTGRRPLPGNPKTKNPLRIRKSHQEKKDTTTALKAILSGKKKKERSHSISGSAFKSGRGRKKKRRTCTRVNQNC